jgi:hypothetical protein
MGDGGVDAGSRVSIPVPHASVVGATFEKLNLVACITEFLELVDATKTGSNNDGVEFVLMHGASD